MASLSTSASVLLEFVQSVATVDRQDKNSSCNKNSGSTYKQDGIASHRGHLCPQVSPTDRLPLKRAILFKVLLAAKDAQVIVVVTESRNLNETPTALVTEVSVTSVASHVVAAGRALDEHSAYRTLLTVGDTTLVPSLCPHMEQLLAPFELLAGEVLVPGGVAVVAPLVIAPDALYLHVLFLESFEFELREFVLSDKATVRASLLVSVSINLEPHPLKSLLRLSAKVFHNLLSPHGCIAVRIGTLDENDPLSDLRLHNVQHAVLADQLIATLPPRLTVIVRILVAHDAGGIVVGIPVVVIVENSVRVLWIEKIVQNAANHRRRILQIAG